MVADKGPHRWDKPFLAFIAGLVVLRLAFHSPFDGSQEPPREVYYGPDGERIEAGLNHLGNVVFYFSLNEETCFAPLDEIHYYGAIQQDYPNLLPAIVFHDPRKSFSHTYPEIGSLLQKRFGYEGPIFFDRNNSAIQKYRIANQTKIFIFDQEGNVVYILPPANFTGQNRRVRDYYELARQL